MRPVDKGLPPAVYAEYRDAAPDLQARLGDYCSYCERQIETHLAIEHIQPKCRVPALALSWLNFLFGCVNCNSCKGNAAITLADYLWPDADNTLRAFEYSPGGLIAAHPELDAAIATKASATIGLLGLDRFPGNAGREPTTADQRWLRRQQAWAKAEKCRDTLSAQDTPEVRDLIVDVATGRGEFSIWWTVFINDADMRRRLREGFVGTHGASFDADENLVARAGGQL
jgi:uncharacterized protein (TIGR02646 family)